MSEEAKVMISNKRLLIIPLIALLLTGCNTPRKSKKRSTTESSQSGGGGGTGRVGPVSGKEISETGRILGTKYVYDIPVGDYYNGLDDSKTGTDLINALHDFNESKITKLTGYSSILGAGFYTDNHGEDGKIYGFYEDQSITSVSGSGWNREHVWPASRTQNGRDEETDPVEMDCLHIRPTDPSANQSRSNIFYGQSSPNFDPGYQIEAYRGEAARIIFYVAIKDPVLKIEDIDNVDYKSRPNTMGKLSDMLRWNLQYAVRDQELYRNSGSQYKQGNRNPFVDHPEYACKIWGSTNSTTRQICGM